jgi:hypothetical protein
MKKMNGKRLGAFALAFFLICGQFFAFPLSVSAAKDDNSYTLVLEYDDNIQLTYEHGTAGLKETTTGDVPVGGAHLNGESGPLVFGQVYCADAEVPFHSRVVGGIPGAYSAPLGAKTKDVVSNYVAVVPNEIPTVLGAHWRELEWIVMNGYQGGGDTDVARMRAAGLTLASPGKDGLSLPGDYGWDVAVMATKAAVWHFTNPDVSFVSTGFLARSGANPDSQNGIKHRQFMALLDALIAGAEAYAASPSSLYVGVTPFEIEISGTFDDTTRTTVTADPTYTSNPKVGGGISYGPFSLQETLGSYNSRPSGTRATPPEALLQFSNKAGSVPRVEFYSADPSIAGAPRLSDSDVYGGAPGDTLPGVGINAPGVNANQFWVYIPQDLPLPDTLEGATIAAVAKESIVSVQGVDVKLPTVLVYQDPITGEQDWAAIQAFVGAATAPLTQYATAAIPYDTSAVTGQLAVFKYADAGEGPFTFQITYEDGTPVYLDSSNFENNPYATPNSAAILNGPDGTFSLAGDMASAWIHDLPLGKYFITEFYNDSFQVHSAVDSLIPGDFALLDTAAVTLTDAVGHDVYFSNDAVPMALSIAKVSAVSEENVMGALLSSAKFRLEQISGGTGTIEETKLTDEEGAAVFSIPLVTPGELLLQYLDKFTPADFSRVDATYELTETDVPANYTQLSGPIKIEVVDGLIAKVTPTSEDVGLVSISGIGTRHLRLVIANVPTDIPYVPDGPSPNTGDNSALSLWVLQGGVAFVILVSLGAALVLRRTKKKKG